MSWPFFRMGNLMTRKFHTHYTLPIKLTSSTIRKMFFLRAIIIVKCVKAWRQTSNCFFLPLIISAGGESENFQRISRRLLSMSIQYHHNSCVQFSSFLVFEGWQQIIPYLPNKNISNFSRIMSFCVGRYHGLFLSRWKNLLTQKITKRIVIFRFSHFPFAPNCSITANVKSPTSIVTHVKPQDIPNTRRKSSKENSFVRNFLLLTLLWGKISTENKRIETND